jgi:hypothetical protein
MILCLQGPGCAARTDRVALRRVNRTARPADTPAPDGTNNVYLSLPSMCGYPRAFHIASSPHDAGNWHGWPDDGTDGALPISGKQSVRIAPTMRQGRTEVSERGAAVPPPSPSFRFDVRLHDRQRALCDLFGLCAFEPERLQERCRCALGELLSAEAKLL